MPNNEKLTLNSSVKTDDPAAIQRAANASAAATDYSVRGEVELSDAEYVRRFRSEQSGNILPKPPEIPGFHTCWVPETSNNMHDNITQRQRLGYAIVKQDELPSFVSPSNRAGQYEGCVSHNELILMKIPDRFYQLLMQDAHYTQPYEQEASVKQKMLGQFVDKSGDSLTRDTNEMTGVNQLARKVAVPKF